MSKNRYSARTDKNQKDIVAALRSIPGVTVVTGMDDILVGYKGLTYWYEIKNPDTVKKNGLVSESKIKKSQKRLKNEFTGHYIIVYSLDQILKDLGII